ncbi:DUF2062 domain-containing protein [Anaerobacillus sp. HL2]|nr:DUF2062 domain-containing protein [Anaerobacillus sp. HL2]
MLNKQLRKMKYLTLRLLRINDNVHSIAIGFTVGLIMNFIPTFGLGPLLSTFTPKLVKGNSVARINRWICLYMDFPVFFYLNIVVGESVLPIRVETK